MLTKSQHKILLFLKSFFQKNNYSPTIAEIAEAIDIKSRGVVHRNLQAIAQNGFIKIITGKRRNIELIQERFGCLPLIGKIAAGIPIEAIEDVEWLDLSTRLFSGEKYLLKVKGDSMIEENICDGDIVICEKNSTASNGNIVVALIDQAEATLKRIKYNKDGTITLFPANCNLKPQIYSSTRVTVQGIFVGLLRL